MQLIKSTYNRELLSESPQTAQIMWSLGASVAPDTLEMVIPWVWCKDYLHDAVAAQALDVTVSAYGLVCEHTTQFGDPRKWKLLLRVLDDKLLPNLREFIPNCLSPYFSIKIEKEIREPVLGDVVLVLDLGETIPSHPSILSLTALAIRLQCYGSFAPLDTLVDFARNCKQDIEFHAVYELKQEFIPLLLNNAEQLTASYPETYRNPPHWVYGTEYHNTRGIASFSRFYYNKTHERYALYLGAEILLANETKET